MSPRKPKPTRRGFGAPRQLPSGRWQARYTGPDTATHIAPHTFDTRQRAEGWLAEERRLIDLDIWTSPTARAAKAAEPEADAILFGAYAEKVIETRVSRQGKPLARRTKDSYRYLLRTHLNPTFENIPITDITLEMVRDWYVGVSRIRATGRKAKPETKATDDVPTARARAYEVIRMVMNVAADDDLIEKNPCRVKGATAIQPAHDATVLQPQEISALANAMPKELRVSVLLAAWCGLRPSETFELRRRSFNADCSVMTISHAATYREREIVVDRPKAGSTGEVVVPQHIRAAIQRHLDQYVDQKPNALLFPDPDNGGTMREWIYRRIFTKACAQIGRKGFRPAELRHTGGTVAAQAGGTLPEVTERLRHKTPQAAMRYQKIAAGRAQTLADNISKLALGPSAAVAPNEWLA